MTLDPVASGLWVAVQAQWIPAEQPHDKPKWRHYNIENETQDHWIDDSAH